MYLTRTRRAAEPATELFSNLNRLNRMMDEALGGGFDGGTLATSWIPAVDVVEDQEHLKIVVELPGVRPEDVKLSLENQVLTIRGEKRQVFEEDKERWHRYERSYGSFERSFTLPSTVDPDHIQAAVEHGVLTVTLPKIERARPREIPIKASNGKERQEVRTEK
jgi:HSP20 family protein